MNILILNSILFTAETAVIPKVKTIKDTMIYGVCLGFVRQDHRVTLAALADYKPTEAEIYDFDVKFFKADYTKICKPSVLPYSSEMRCFLKRHHADYDMVISSEVFQLPSLYAARICPEKTIIWQELTTHQNKMHQIPSRIWYNVVAKYCMSRVRVVVARSQLAHRFVSRFMPRVSDIIIDHGINVDKFKSCVEKKRQIISSSQLIHRKNVDGIIRKFAAFHQLKGYEDVKLLIAGRGEEEIKLKQLVVDLELAEAVIFVGFVPQKTLGDFIRKSMIFLVNTRKDLNMVSISESIICGTPVLTNLQPASADYIAANHLGIAKEEWGIDELKDIIDNNKKYVDNCVAYRSRLTSEYSAQLFIDVYKNTSYLLPNQGKSRG